MHREEVRYGVFVIALVVGVRGCWSIGCGDVEGNMHLEGQGQLMLVETGS